MYYAMQKVGFSNKESSDLTIKNNANQILWVQFTLSVVRVTGLEPAQRCRYKNLNLTRLPISPHPHIKLCRLKSKIYL